MIVSRTDYDAGMYNLSTIDISNRKLIPNKAGLPRTDKLHNAQGLLDIFVDSVGNNWLLAGGNLFYSIKSENIFQRIDLPASPFGVESVFEECSAEVVCFRTDGRGLGVISPLSIRFETIISSKDVSNSTKFRNLKVDSENNVWVINSDNRILKWHREQNAWADKTPENTPTIRGLEILPDDSVWILIPSIQKILGFDPKTHSWRFEIDTGSLSPVLSQMKDGRLLAVSNNRLIGINGQSGDFAELSSTELPGQTRVVIQDHESNYWIGSHEAGLTKIDATGQFINNWNTNNSKLKSNHIYSLNITTSGILWIGTWHGGLFSFDLSTEKIEQHSVEEGIPASTIFAVLEDEKKTPMA